MPFFIRKKINWRTSNHSTFLFFLFSLIFEYQEKNRKKNDYRAWNLSSDKMATKVIFTGERVKKYDWWDTEFNWMPNCGTCLLKVEQNTLINQMGYRRTSWCLLRNYFWSKKRLYSIIIIKLNNISSPSLPISLPLSIYLSV